MQPETRTQPKNPREATILTTNGKYGKTQNKGINPPQIIALTKKCGRFPHNPWL
jgi:hypothetical protein